MGSGESASAGSTDLAPIRVLLVEDEEQILRLLAGVLMQHGITSESASTLASARAIAATGRIDVVVLDRQLPDGDGLELVRELRAHSSVPIIILTGRSEERDRVQGLEGGADDYVAKPFSPRELVARVRAAARRRHVSLPVEPGMRSETARVYRFSGWTLNVPLRRLFNPAGVPIRLTNTEFNLLVAFLKSPQIVLSRDALLTASRMHADLFNRSIDVQVLRLRRKLHAAGQSEIIVTRRSAGYCLQAGVAAEW